MRGNRFFIRHPRATLATLLAVAVLLLDIAAANCSKHLFRYRFNKHDHEKDYRVESDVYHHGLKPNAVVPVTRFGNRFYSVKTNSLGFRDAAPREVALRSDRRRIVLLGDSFTEGVGCDYEDTFAGIAAAALEPKGVEVLNASAVSYSPTIHNAKIRHLVDTVGLEFNDLVILLDVSDAENEAFWYTLGPKGNVVTNEAGRGRAEELGRLHDEAQKRKRSLFTRVERFLRRDTMLVYWAVRKGHDLFYERDLFQDFFAINTWWGLWPSDPEVFTAYGRAGLDGMIRSMDQLQAFCQERGIRLSVGVYPWIDQIARHEADNRHVRAWRAWCAERGVAFFDLTPAFIFPGMEARTVLEENFIFSDIHWNERGHRRIADVLLPLLDPALSPPGG